MNNRAKCKLCKDIIQSFHPTDFVSCSCGEISLDGGPLGMRVFATDFANLLRVDDQGNEIVVKVVEKGHTEMEVENREDLMDCLKGMVQRLKELPPGAATAHITHYDFYVLTSLLYDILKR